MNPYFAEFLGTLVLILMGDGVCACTSLEKSKGKGAGWVVITLAWGFAVMCGVFIAGPYSGAHLNPAVTIGLAVAGSFPWASVLGYIIAQMLGGFCGATLVWAFYKDHYDATDGIADDNNEKKFARSLDQATEVCVYAKLPRGFQIPTPVGNYSPDWAIAFNEGTVKHVFFIAETKGDMSSMELRPIEKAKIDCARALFNNLSGADVRYDCVDSYEKLLSVMQK
jgi:hypothetical protein